jgi:hypothetical protein
MSYLQKTFMLALCAASMTAGQAHATKTVGVIGASNPSIHASDISGNQRMLKVGVDVFFNDIIKTGPEGNAQIIFEDRSALTLGPNSSVMIDRFVYNPFTKKGKLSVNALKGAFRFIGGALSKNKAVTIKTPVSTIGIRGGIVMFHVAPNGATDATFLYGDKLTVKSNSGVERATKNYGYGINVKDNFSAPTLPKAVESAKMAGAIASLTAKHGTNGGAVIIPSAKLIKEKMIIKMMGSDEKADVKNNDKEGKSKAQNSKKDERKKERKAKRDDSNKKQSDDELASKKGDYKKSDKANNGTSGESASSDEKKSDNNSSATNKGDKPFIVGARDERDEKTPTTFDTVSKKGGDKIIVKIDQGVLDAIINGEKVDDGDMIATGEISDVTINDIKEICAKNPSAPACVKVIAIINDGYDEDGFNIDGYDNNGFNAEGFNRAGYDKEGFNSRGFNVAGLDRGGFDHRGFNSDGFDKDGFGPDGFNSAGLDNKGLNRDGKTQEQVAADKEIEKKIEEEEVAKEEPGETKTFEGETVDGNIYQGTQATENLFTGLQDTGDTPSAEAILLRTRTSLTAFNDLGLCGGEKCEHLSWGVWNLPTDTINTTGSNQIAFIEDGRNLAISGNITSNLSALAENLEAADLPAAGIVEYSGDIFGSHSDTDFSENVTDTGTFSSTVNIGNQTMTAFDATLAGIDGSSINLSLVSDGIIAKTGAAIFNDVSVEGSIGGGSSTNSGIIYSGTINGALFGAKAEEIGGLYSASSSTTEAAGVFAGKR